MLVCVFAMLDSWFEKEGESYEDHFRGVILQHLWFGGIMAQTHAQEHRHEPYEDQKDGPAQKGAPMKGEMKKKMIEKMKNVKCCAKEDEKEQKG